MMTNSSSGGRERGSGGREKVGDGRTARSISLGPRVQDRAVRSESSASSEPSGRSVLQRVTIHGRVGTGRKKLAEELHKRDRDAARPFVVVDCRHSRSWDAPRRFLGEYAEVRPGHYLRYLGALEEARDGTLLLEGVESLPRDVQILFRDVLESGSFTPIRGSEPVRYRAQTITLTTESLDSLVQRGEFDEQLAEILSQERITTEG